MWLLMTENILSDCSFRNSVKQIDNEVTKGNRCLIFQKLVNHAEMLHSPQGFKPVFAGTGKQFQNTH